MVKLKTPFVCGTPDNEPLPANVRPAGNAPLASEKLYGGVPPSTVKTTSNCSPITAFGKPVGAIVRPGQLMVIEKSCEPVQGLVSVALIEKLNVPVTVGIPEIEPSAEKLSPSGS